MNFIKKIMATFVVKRFFIDIHNLHSRIVRPVNPGEVTSFIGEISFQPVVTGHFLHNSCCIWLDSLSKTTSPEHERSTSATEDGGTHIVYPSITWGAAQASMCLVGILPLMVVLHWLVNPLTTPNAERVAMSITKV